MNPEVSRQKYEKYMARESVSKTIDLLTQVISQMYEDDQNHKDADPLQTLKERLGIS